MYIYIILILDLHFNNSYSNESNNKRNSLDPNYEESSVASSLKNTRAKELGEIIFQVNIYLIVKNKNNISKKVSLIYSQFN